ncbi:DUF3576 domain-containing protein [Thalassobius sp. I31.1]|uniref:DUF3576 domain-containing protein n=1 Tax=Thalassobius sp. I31.1 TaxID=2109912 RepID=UPI000D1BD633|nr:DUF3576 domain-containing protein [Thalassobius sp. I31.1]
MKTGKTFAQISSIAAILVLTACGNSTGGKVPEARPGDSRNSQPIDIQARQQIAGQRESIWDIFDNQSDSNTTLEVNKYIWRASLETLNFLPIQTADPFSGVISTGYGTPPGGGRSYRATMYITDPALDARSLNLSLQTSGGRAVDADTRRAVEDAILTRARQLRIAEGKL